MKCVTFCIVQKKKGGWPKGKKRKKMRDSNAPKPALNGYLHFLNERREILRRENPTMAFAEMIRVLGAEWTKLPQHEKQVSASLLLIWKWGVGGGILICRGGGGEIVICRDGVGAL